MVEEPVSKEVAEAMGVSNAAYDEVVSLLRRLPDAADLSTLLAMWDSNGRQQGLLSWLRGQPHAQPLEPYLFAGEWDEHVAGAEPRIRECLAAAQQLLPQVTVDDEAPFVATGESLFLIGNCGGQVTDSEYARRCLHLAAHPVHQEGTADDLDYIALIVDVLAANGIIHTHSVVGRGGLFFALLSHARPARKGFDILCAREIRLDAFLFGETPGRVMVSLAEKDDDFFLLKMDEARLNCCFLGRTTGGRIVVDGYDFGSITRWNAPAVPASDASIIHTN